MKQLRAVWNGVERGVRAARTQRSQAPRQAPGQPPCTLRCSARATAYTLCTLCTLHPSHPPPPSPPPPAGPGRHHRGAAAGQCAGGGAPPSLHPIEPSPALTRWIPLSLLTTCRLFPRSPPRLLHGTPDRLRRLCSTPPVLAPPLPPNGPALAPGAVEMPDAQLHPRRPPRHCRPRGRRAPRARRWAWCRTPHTAAPTAAPASRPATALRARSYGAGSCCLPRS
jgi:hypothetical protein